MEIGEPELRPRTVGRAVGPAAGPAISSGGVVKVEDEGEGVADPEARGLDLAPGLDGGDDAGPREPRA